MSPAAFPWQYILLDVDGTLLNSQGAVTERTHHALCCVAEQATLIIATGRHKQSLWHVSQQWKLPQHYSITNGGAVTWLPAFAKSAHLRVFQPILWQQIATRLTELGLSVVVYGHQEHAAPTINVCSLEGDTHYCQYLNRTKGEVRVHTCWEDVTGTVIEVAAIGSGDSFSAHSAQALAEFQLLSSCHKMTLFLGARYGEITEFMPPNTSKWEAFIALFPEAAHHPEQVVAIGDGENDMAMITHAGTGVAMGNGTEALRNAANRVIGSNDEEGLAKFLAPYLGQNS